MCSCAGGCDGSSCRDYWVSYIVLCKWDCTICNIHYGNAHSNAPSTLICSYYRPVDRKMVINGLNSGANVYMADFEGELLRCAANLNFLLVCIFCTDLHLNQNHLYII